MWEASEILERLQGPTIIGNALDLDTPREKSSDGESGTSVKFKLFTRTRPITQKP